MLVANCGASSPDGYVTRPRSDPPERGENHPANERMQDGTYCQGGMIRLFCYPGAQPQPICGWYDFNGGNCGASWNSICPAGSVPQLGSNTTEVASYNGACKNKKNFQVACCQAAATITADYGCPAVERADQPSDGHTLPLLRLSGWESEKQYDKRIPVCIHYDFQWKISQREKIRARRVYSDTDHDLVPAPSDFWKLNFQTRLDNYLKDEDKFPEDRYTCEETIIEVSVERSRRRGLTKRYKNLEIDWQQVDEHLEGLSDLFSMGRKITLSMEFVYKEVACDSTTAKDKKKKKKSATDAQSLQRIKNKEGGKKIGVCSDGHHHPKLA